MKVRPSHVGRTINWATRNKGKLAIAGSVGFHAAATGFLASLSESAIDLVGQFGLVALAPTALIFSVAHLIRDHLKTKRSYLPQVEAALVISIKEQRAKTVNQARAALAQYTSTGTSDINWGKFFPKAEILEEIHENQQLDRLPLPKKEWDQALDKYSQELNSFLQDLPDDPLLRFQAAYGYLSLKGLYKYRPGQANLYRRLEGSGGNCQSQAKFVLTLGAKIHDWDQSDWKPAVAKYKNHLEIVLFNKKTRQVHEPVTRSTVDNGQVSTSIYDAHLFASAYLKGRGLSSLNPEEFLLAEHDPSLNDYDHEKNSRANSKFRYAIKKGLPSFIPWYSVSRQVNLIRSIVIPGARGIATHLVRVARRNIKNFIVKIIRSPKKIILIAILMLAAAFGAYLKRTSTEAAEQKQELAVQPPHLTRQEAIRRLAELKEIVRRSTPLSRAADASLCLKHLRRLSLKISPRKPEEKLLSPREKLSFYEYEKILDIFLSPEGSVTFSKAEPEPDSGPRLIYKTAFFNFWSRDFNEFESAYVNGFDLNIFQANFPAHLRQMQQTEWQQYRNNTYFLPVSPSGNLCPYKDELAKAGYLKEDTRVVHDLVDGLSRPEDLDLPLDLGAKEYCFSALKSVGIPTPVHHYRAHNLLTLKLLQASKIHLVEQNTNSEPQRYDPPSIAPQPPIEVEIIYDKAETVATKPEAKAKEWKDQTNIYISAEFAMRLIDHAANPLPLDVLSKIEDEDINKIRPDLIKLLKQDKHLWIFNYHQRVFFDYKSRTRTLLEQDLSETKKKLLLAVLYKYFMSFTGLKYKNGSIVPGVALEDFSSDLAVAIQSHRALGENDPLLRKARKAYLELVREES